MVVIIEHGLDCYFRFKWGRKCPANNHEPVDSKTQIGRLIKSSVAILVIKPPLVFFFAKNRQALKATTSTKSEAPKVDCAAPRVRKNSTDVKPAFLFRHLKKNFTILPGSWAICGHFGILMVSKFARHTKHNCLEEKVPGRSRLRWFPYSADYANHWLHYD